jgi:hypothetical protein
VRSRLGDLNLSGDRFLHKSPIEIDGRKPLRLVQPVVRSNAESHDVAKRFRA